jgi:hypothetical protein
MQGYIFNRINSDKYKNKKFKTAIDIVLAIEGKKLTSN